MADFILSDGGAGATASAKSLRALQNRQGSVNRCSRDAVLLKTRGGDPQLVLCQVASRSHDVRESCRRVNMQENTASTAISSHEVFSLVPALTTRATRLDAHNPVCHFCMCDRLTGRPGRAVAVGGLTVGRGVAPQLCTAHPRGPSQHIPIRASKGMICPDLGEIGFGRGRGFSPVVFPTPLLLV